MYEGFGPLSVEEECDYWAPFINAELARVTALVEVGSVAEAFDQRGRLYNIALSLAPWARQEDIGEMDHWLGASEGKLRSKTVVDIAAGTGFLTEQLLKWTGEMVYAVDPSDVQLRRLMRNCHPYGPVDRVLGSPDQPAIFDQIPEGSIDVVTSFGGIHHVANHEDMFANVSRLLKSGGRFMAADVGDTGENAPLRDHFDLIVARKCLTGHQANWLSKERLRELCQDLPLRTERICERVPLAWIFQSERQMALFFKALHAYPQAESEILADLRRTLGWEVRGGLIYLNWPMLFFEIVKT